MAMFIIQNGMVECPACGTILDKLKEQDRRVSIMRHEGSRLCSLYHHSYRVDRLNGHAEEYHEA